jgi:hypothetical protein
MSSIPRLLQGVFPFEGKGLACPSSMGEALRYQVPAGRRAQFVYFRGGNTADTVVCATLTRDGTPMRMFPVGARGACHVPLAVIEDLLPNTLVELVISAPKGVTGEIIVDVGLVEFPDDGFE